MIDFKKIRLYIGIKIRWLRKYFFNDEEMLRMVLLETKMKLLDHNIDLSEYTDDQIIVGLPELMKVLRNANYTREQMVEVARQLSAVKK